MMDEYATPSCTAMKPPDESPETDVCVISRLSAGNGGGVTGSAKEPGDSVASTVAQIHRMALMGSSFAVLRAFYVLLVSIGKGIAALVAESSRMQALEQCTRRPGADASN
jgi:hypothetical protein